MLPKAGDSGGTQPPQTSSFGERAVVRAVDKQDRRTAPHRALEYLLRDMHLLPPVFAPLLPFRARRFRRLPHGGHPSFSPPRGNTFAAPSWGKFHPNTLRGGHGRSHHLDLHPISDDICRFVEKRKKRKKRSDNCESNTGPSGTYKGIYAIVRKGKSQKD